MIEAIKQIVIDILPANTHYWQTSVGIYIPISKDPERSIEIIDGHFGFRVLYRIDWHQQHRYDFKNQINYVPPTTEVMFDHKDLCDPKFFDHEAVIKRHLLEGKRVG